MEDKQPRKDAVISEIKATSDCVVFNLIQSKHFSTAFNQFGTTLCGLGDRDLPQFLGVVSGPAADRGRSYIPPADSAFLALSSGPEASPAPVQHQHEIHVNM